MNQEPTRYKIGQEVTVNEVRLAYSRINAGRPLPRVFNARQVADFFIKTLPVRFEFEVNRQRGFAWDNGDDPICVE